jgi:hypothetical protein
MNYLGKNVQCTLKHIVDVPRDSTAMTSLLTSGPVLGRINVDDQSYTNGKFIVVSIDCVGVVIRDPQTDTTTFVENGIVKDGCVYSYTHVYVLDTSKCIPLDGRGFVKRDRDWIWLVTNEGFYNVINIHTSESHVLKRSHLGGANLISNEHRTLYDRITGVPLTSVGKDYIVSVYDTIVIIKEPMKYRIYELKYEEITVPTCYVCGVEISCKTHVFYPCRHSNICSACAKKSISACPKCSGGCTILELQ